MQDQDLLLLLERTEAYGITQRRLARELREAFLVLSKARNIGRLQRELQPDFFSDGKWPQLVVSVDGEEGKEKGLTLHDLSADGASTSPRHRGKGKRKQVKKGEAEDKEKEGGREEDEGVYRGARGWEALQERVGALRKASELFRKVTATAVDAASRATVLKQSICS